MTSSFRRSNALSRQVVPRRLKAHANRSVGVRLPTANHCTIMVGRPVRRELAEADRAIQLSRKIRAGLRLSYIFTYRIRIPFLTPHRTDTTSKKAERKEEIRSWRCSRHTYTRELTGTFGITSDVTWILIKRGIADSGTLTTIPLLLLQPVERSTSRGPVSNPEISGREIYEFSFRSEANGRDRPHLEGGQ